MTIAPEIADLGGAQKLAAMEAAGLGAWHWLLAGDRAQLSRQAQILLGCEVAELSGKQFLALVLNEDRPTVERSLRDNLAAGREHDVDFRTAADGKWRRMRGRAAPGAQEAHGILLDIGDRRAAQMSDSRLAAIVASSEDAIIGQTLDGLVTAWNPGAQAVFGFTAADMMDNPLGALLPPGRENEERDILAR